MFEPITWRDEQCHHRFKDRSMLSAETTMKTYIDMWLDTKKTLDELEKIGYTDSRIAHKWRNAMISYWNKMTPQQQKEIANKYCQEG